MIRFKNTNRVAVLLMIFYSCFGSGVLFGQDSAWMNATGGDFQDTANWSNGIPGLGINAVFDLPATYNVDLTAHHGMKSFAHSNGSVTFSGGRLLSLTSSSRTNGNLRVTGLGTQIDVNAPMLIRGSANVTIVDEAVVKTGLTVIGDIAGDNATLNVNGVGSAWQCDSLFLGTPDGVTDGGQGLLDTDADGSFNIGAVATTYDGQIGSTVSPARLFIRNGSQFNSGVSMGMAEEDNSTGEIAISGIGSEMNQAGLNAAYRGVGTVTVDDGGLLNVGFLTAGYHEDSNGSILVSGPGSKMIVGAMEIGWVYGSGSLTVENGAELEGIDCHIGELGGQGVMTVTGANSKANISGEIYVGRTYASGSGNFSNGVLNVLDGGVVVTGELVVADDDEPTGHVNVSGMNSRLLCETLSLSDSDGGEAFMSISLGGTVGVGDDVPVLPGSSISVSNSDGTNPAILCMQRGALIQNEGNATVGYWIGSAGKVVLEGSGTRWSNGGDLEIGAQGVGEVSIADGARLIAGGTTMMNEDSMMTIDGGFFESTGGLVSDGLIETTGDSVMRGNVELGTNAAEINVSGISSDLTIEGNVDFNLGTVTVFDGCTLRFAGDFDGDGLGSVGTVDCYFAGDVSMGNNTTDLYMSGGNVHLEETSNLKLRLEGTDYDDFDSLDVSSLSIAPGANITVELINGFSLEQGQQFLIVSTRNGSDTFSGLAEGDLVGSFGGVNLFITYVAGDGNDIALFTGGTRVVSPHNFSVTRGILASGEVQELSRPDNRDLSIRRSNTDIQSRTEFVIESRSPTMTPSSMEIRLECSVFARSDISQKIWLYDYSSEVWEEVDDRIASRFVDRVDTVVLNGDLTRFVESGTGRLRARVQHRSSIARRQISSNTDNFAWRIGE